MLFVVALFGFQFSGAQASQFVDAHIIGFGKKCLDQRGPYNLAGTAVQLWDCKNISNQKWTYDESNGWISSSFGDRRCIEARSTNNGVQVTMQNC